MREKRWKVEGEKAKKGRLGAVDAWKKRHLVNLRELVGQSGGPCLTLSRQRLADVVEDEESEYRQRWS
jgi:hypothetical protein